LTPIEWEPEEAGNKSAAPAQAPETDAAILTH